MDAMQIVNADDKPPTATRRRHETLYICDETVVFLVEDTFFRVHKHFLRRHSKVFATMFTLPPGDAQAEGQTDDNAIHLSGVKAIDFQRLLSLFYPTVDHIAEIQDLATLILRNIPEGDLSSVEEWTSVLDLSTKWSFDSLRALAITKLESVATPVDRIVLANQYHIQDWLIPAYVELAKRGPSLTLAENTKLGMATATLVADIRVTVRGVTTPRASEASIIATITQAIVQMSQQDA